MNESYPQVSIVVPVYNAEPFLRECIVSVIGQTFGDWELILVDDESTDGSLGLCRQMAEEHPEYQIRIYPVSHRGVSGARNYGVERASAPFILFLDADDVLQHQTLELLLPSASLDTIVVGQFDYSPVCRLPRNESLQVYGVFSARQAILLTLYQVPVFHNSPWGILYPRTFLLREKFVENRRYEDLEIFSRLYSQADNIVILENTVVWYRAHGGSFINTVSAARMDALWATDKILERMKATGDHDLIRAAESRRFSAYYNMFAIAAKVGDRQLERQCLKVIKQYRKQILTDYEVRDKNKAGALLSYLGPGIMRMVSRIVYR